VHAPPSAIDPAEHLFTDGEQSAFDPMTQHFIVADLHIDDRSATELATVRHLTAALGIKRGPIEDDRGSPAALVGRRDDTRAEFEQARS
jgi:hypothetical protein